MLNLTLFTSLLPPPKIAHIDIEFKRLGEY